MTTTLGKTTFGRKNPFNIGLLLGGVAIATFFGGLGIWEATQSNSSSPPAQPEAAAGARPDFTRLEPVQTYVYLVDSEAQKNAILQADLEQQLGVDGTAFNHNTQVIDLSTPEGREAYGIMNAELSQVSMEAPDYVSNVHFVDLTVPASTSVQTPATSEIDAGVPTYFYIIDSQEQADRLLQAEAMSTLEMMLVGETSNQHHTMIVDVSTLEGQQLLNTINGELHEFWADPSVDKSLIQVVDIRD